MVLWEQLISKATNDCDKVVSGCLRDIFVFGVLFKSLRFFHVKEWQMGKFRLSRELFFTILQFWGVTKFLTLNKWNAVIQTADTFLLLWNKLINCYRFLRDSLVCSDYVFLVDKWKVVHRQFSATHFRWIQFLSEFYKGFGLSMLHNTMKEQQSDLWAKESDLDIFS